ncbi:MAG: hypothetical protein PHF84_11280, partial [bacterium]|nr:hypothetical protein [bacterium]
NTPSPYHVHRYNDSFANAVNNFLYDGSSADATEIQSNASFVTTLPASPYFIYLSPTYSACINKGDPNDPVPPKGGSRIDIGAVETTNQPYGVNLYYPADGLWTNSLNFIWSKAQQTGTLGILNYKVEISTNAGFVPVSTTNLAASTNYPTTLATGKYYWHVRPNDKAGNTGLYSLSRTINVDTNKPAVSNPSPPTLTSINSLTVNFSWTGSDTGGSGMTNYLIQIDENGNTNTWEVNTLVTSASYSHVFSTNGLFSWKVSPHDKAGNWGVPGFWQLTIDTNKPGMVTLSTPQDNSWSVTNSPRFVWNKVVDLISGISNYRIQVSLDAGFSAVIRNNTTVLTGIQVAALTNGTYYWHVRASDNAGNQGPYSTGRIIRIDDAEPVVSSPLPSDGSALTAMNVNFSWSGSDTGYSGITNYLIKLDINGDTNTWEITATNTSPAYSRTFITNGTYHWKVNALDRAGNQSGFSYWTFSIDTNVAIPELYYPSGVIVTTNMPDFRWSNETDKNALKYWIQISTNTNFSIVAYESSNYNAATTNGSPGAALSPDGKFFWHVRAKKASGWQNWPVTASFRIDTSGPSQVTLNSPPDNAWTASALFIWNTAVDTGSGVKNYRIEICLDTNFTVQAATNTVSGLTYTAVLTNGPYFWRVRANDNAGFSGTWSLFRKMNLDTIPPVFGYNVNGEISLENGEEYTLTWNPATDQSGISKYTLIIDGVEKDIGLVTVYALSFTASGQHQVKVRAYDNTGLYTDSGLISFNVTTSLAAGETKAYPVPCPRDRSLIIEYGYNGTKAVDKVNLKIYDVLGSEVLDKDFTLSSGIGRLEWDLQNNKGKTIMPGVYLFKMEIKYSDGSKDTSDYRKIIIKK